MKEKDIRSTLASLIEITILWKSRKFQEQPIDQHQGQFFCLDAKKRIPIISWTKLGMEYGKFTF